MNSTHFYPNNNVWRFLFLFATAFPSLFMSATCCNWCRFDKNIPDRDNAIDFAEQL